MHPAGIKFGLSHGLLELSGADVVLSEPFLESISELAHHKVQRRKRVMGIWDEVVYGGLGKVLVSTTAPRQEYVPFVTGLDRIVLETMMPLAERAKIGRREGRYFFTNREFWEGFRHDIRRPSMRKEPSASFRLHFRETYAEIKKLCAEYTPENLHHSELLALCQINCWNLSRNRLTLDDFLD
jgi:hypothetical protein